MKTNKSEVKIITVYYENINQRIDNFLLNFLKKIPKSFIYKIIRTGQIRINKKRISAKYKLKYLDKIRIPPIIYFNKTNNNYQNKIFYSNKIKIDKNIIYEDDYIMILNKQSGDAVHGGSGLNFGIIEYLRFYKSKNNFFELVHRLDKDTSGILLIAKKKFVLKELHRQLRLNEIYKEYLTLVKGNWNSNVTKVSIPLMKKKFFHQKHKIIPNINGKHSETVFSIQENFSFATLLKVVPMTGRTHQIRVHSQYYGHPIAFDKKYGNKDFDDKLETYGLNRLFLHAYSIKFRHPYYNKKMCVKASLDDKLSNFLNNLRKNDYL